MKKGIITFGLFVIGLSAIAKEITRQEYIETWTEDAIYQMHQYGIPASITLAQGILESGNGNSYLATYANNHFGIKCHGWEGQKAYKDDDKRNECFRKYLSPVESYMDHSKFLANGSRYDFLFDYKITDYKAWAKGLKEAGYATNPRYPESLIRLIEENQLYVFDKELVPQQEKVAKSGVEEESKASSAHSVMLSDNRVKYIKVKQGDTFYSIATEFQMGLWQLYKYNDITENDILKVGDLLYLQPKRKKAKSDYHVVKPGETLRDISQQYAIKLKKLAKRNEIDKWSALRPGQKVILR